MTQEKSFNGHIALRTSPELHEKIFTTAKAKKLTMNAFIGIILKEYGFGEQEVNEQLSSSESEQQDEPLFSADQVALLEAVLSANVSSNHKVEMLRRSLRP
jgi:hypothetical protein